eukprot:10957461-Heterocapsa_arctica.AAC.1
MRPTPRRWQTAFAALESVRTLRGASMPASASMCLTKRPSCVAMPRARSSASQVESATTG